ncbi:ATP-binding protein [Accumulibacter sp.]|uniref:ATP-binding protein n=1 Tax=Accumulibacter sp. TaxID=2053492 RepID=UPI0035AF660D
MNVSRQTHGADALREYRAIFDNAAVGIVFTRDRTIYRCNRRSVELLGYRPGELEGLPGRDMYPSQESYEEIGRQAGPLLAAGLAFESDWQYKRRDGQLVWFHVYARAVDPQRTDQGTVWILEDVSEARRVHEAHRQALAEMQAIMDNASVAILFTRERKLARYNPRFAELFGYPGESAIGLPGRALYPSDEDYAEIGRRASPLLSQGRPFQHEQFLQRADGSRFWANMIAYLIDPEDPGKGTIWLVEDRSQFKRAEEALQENLLQLKESNRRLEDTQSQLLQAEKMASIGQLAAGVAHEINNPVGFVSSNMRTLATYTDGLLKLIDAYAAVTEKVPLPADAAATLQALRTAIDLDYLRDDLQDLLHESDDGLQRVRQIVQDLKDFSHIDSGEWTAVDLNACIKSTLNVVWNELKYKAKIDFVPGDLPEVRCNAPQVNQVIMNLLVNAAQAIESSGTISIRSGHDGTMAWFEIEDTGSGMSEQVRRRIFEPFFTTKAVGTGTGLGLSVSYGIVNKHGGRMEVFSTPGVGTRFRVSLPIAGRPDSVPATLA